MPGAANGLEPRPRNAEPASPSAEQTRIRVERPANDNLPQWALRVGRGVLVGGLVLAVLVAALLLFAA